MKTIVECVPNFSEGRRLAVIEEIVAEIRAVPRTQVLDVHSDPDHNRTVVTFVGPPEEVGEAAFRAIRQAARLIDMREHQGEHPRLGATDVVPFVPVSGVTLEDCVALARRLGQRVGQELDIPVYLYEAAATRPGRVNLAAVRRGQYEGLKAEIETNPVRAPDFGPARIGPAGATVIGARPFLVAYNVYLNTSDVNVAKKIARAIRHSSGGLRFVKAMGLLVEGHRPEFVEGHRPEFIEGRRPEFVEGRRPEFVEGRRPEFIEGQTQVSMNLTNFEKTPIHRVVELIRREAAHYGTAITHGEVVGLVPQAALVESARWYLQLDDFHPGQVLENKMAAQADITPTEFIDAVAANTPTPGGGSVAALAGALAAALAAMAGRLTVGKKKYAGVQAEMEALIEQGEALRSRLTAAIALDSQAFDGVMAAYRLARQTDAEKAARQDAIQAATHQAALVPLGVAHDALAAMRLAAQAATHGNPSAISDAGSAALMAQAAIGAAALNVQINAQSLADEAVAQGWLDELKKIQSEAEALSAEVKKTLAARADLYVDVHRQVA
jgi:glutamate formiminotransferase/formiminotetrahydrofolate cyclodeaminase